MTVAGFSYTKISVERKGNIQKGTEIKNNVLITDLKESILKMGKEEKTSLVVGFTFSVDYGSAGKLEFLGNVVVIDSSENTKKAVDSWKKDQKIPAEICANIYNYLLIRCNIRALQLEEDIGLPLHIRMPRLQPKK